MSPAQPVRKPSCTVSGPLTLDVQSGNAPHPYHGKLTFSQMKTGVLTVPAGFGEHFPSQNKLLSTETGMVTLLITVLPPSVKLGKMAGGKKKTQPLYCHFCGPVLFAIENDGGAGQKVSHRQGGDTASCLTGSFSRGQSCT